MNLCKDVGLLCQNAHENGYCRSKDGCTIPAFLDGKPLSYFGARKPSKKEKESQLKRIEKWHRDAGIYVGAVNCPNCLIELKPDHERKNWFCPQCKKEYIYQANGLPKEIERSTKTIDATVAIDSLTIGHAKTTLTGSGNIKMKGKLSRGHKDGRNRKGIQQTRE